MNHLLRGAIARNPNNLNDNIARSSVIYGLLKKIKALLFFCLSGLSFSTGISLSSPPCPCQKRPFPRTSPACSNLSVLVIALFIGGCGGSDEPPPAFNRIRSQTAEALIRAIEEENPEQAVRQLARMAEFSDKHSDITYLKKQERNRLLIQQLNPLLEKSELERAEEVIEQHVKTHGIGEAAEQSRILVKELMALREFPQLVPETDTLSLKAELNQELIPRLEMFGNHPAVQDWLDRQRAAIELLYQAEIDNQANTLLLEIDQKLALGERTAIPEILTDLKKLRPRHLFFELQSRLFSAPSSVNSHPPPLISGDFEKEKEGLYLFCLELALLYNWEETNRRGQDFAALVWEFLERHEPMSIAGLGLRARLAAKLEKPGKAISYLFRFGAAGGIPDHEFYRSKVEKHILPHPRILIRPRLAPFFQNPDVIMRVPQFTEDSGTKGEF